MRSVARRSGQGRQPLRVAIVGAGFSGIAAAVALQKRGIDFVVFESAAGIGGTWWKNRYPGAEVDLESHVYSFSFERSDWSRTHVGWQELQQYLERTAHKRGLIPHIRLQEKIESVTWSDQDQWYTLTTSSGIDHGTFDAVISAVGFLNIPVVPPFARGDTEFTGQLCHTSTWPDGLDMTGKRVGVVGTGSSAVQVIESAQRTASSVEIFQLEPNWILPKLSRTFTEEERRWNRNPAVYAWRRWRLFLGYDLRQIGAGHARADGRINRQRKSAAEKFMSASLAGRPDLLEHTTPTFAFEARRTVLSDTYYPALLDPKVTLVPYGVKGMTPGGVVDANGDEHDLDVVVLATGFDAANYLANIQVFGSRGVEIHDAWEGEPEAFLGMMVPGFPNFFMMYGPNTNSVPLPAFYEAQGAFAASVLARMRRKGHRRVEVRRWVMVAYNDWLQSRIQRTVWATTRSYFTAGTGRVVSQWPYGFAPYLLLTRLLRRIAVRAE